MSASAGALAAANIDRLLRPKSVAIVGASATPGALGHSVLKNLNRLGFDGDIYLINPKRTEIDGLPCIKSVQELPEGVDAAVLAIPRAFVRDTVRDLAARGCGSAIIFSAGFAESGEEGLAEQREIGAIARDTGIVVEGPNCLGCVNYIDQIALTFVESPTPRLGDRKGVAIISQSGAMAAVLASNFIARDVGLSYSVSTGNEAASGIEDYVEYMIADDRTSVIAMIVEQVRQPRRFQELARKAREAGKPIVLLHPGRSEAAAQSAATHTGAMAGDYQVMRTLVERAGVILVNSLEELGDVTEIAARVPQLPRGGCVVLTESGAFKALTLDLCDEIGLSMPVLTDESAPQLRAAMPDFVAVSNPVDMTAQGLVDPDMYSRVLTAAAQDDRFGTIVLDIIQTDDSTTEKKFPPIIGALKALKSPKPIIFAGVDEGGIVKPEYIKTLRDQRVPYFPSPDRALRAISALTDYSERQHAVASKPPTHVRDLPAYGVVPEHAAKAILGPMGIPFPESRMAASVGEAITAANELGYPVVLKAQSPELSHKSDAGGVAIGLTCDEDVETAWAEMHTRVGAYRKGLKLDGILVEAMGEPGLEMIIGARNEPGWGPVILIGFGGTMAEIYKDVRLIAADLTEEGILQELNKLKAADLLHGFRGSEPVDLDAVVEIVMKIGQLSRGEPSIREIDLNPVVVYPRGCGAVALDALILVQEST